MKNTAENISKYGLFRAFLALFMIFGVSFNAYSQNILSLRSYHGADSSRIVVDLDSKIDYSKSLSDDKSAFAVRIRGVSNASSAPSTVKLNKQTCIQSVSKALDGSDVRYLFRLNGCRAPRVFTLDPSADSKNYRLVMDFAVDSNNRQFSSEAKDPVIVDTKKSLADLERALFIKYSTPGEDGLRSMNKEQAAAYKKELAALRAQYAAAKENAKKPESNSQSHVSGTLTDNARHEREEVATDTAAPPDPKKVAAIDMRAIVIAIDAGHGGKDPGAIGKRGVREKNVTLAISKALNAYINADKRFLGVMIRNTDVFVDLNRRSQIARSKKADLLVSIHADSVESGSSTARGASVLVLSDRRANYELDQTLKKNEQKTMLSGGKDVTTNGYCVTESCQKAVASMVQSNSMSEGDILAKEILNSLAKFTHIRKNSPIDRSLAVIKAPDIPSLLIETGYLSNATEEIHLNQINYQKQIAYHIYLGICSYYDKYIAPKVLSRIDAASRNQTKGRGSHKSVTVQRGDTLSKIAAENHVSVQSLKKLNNLKTDVVFVGQKLVLP